MHCFIETLFHPLKFHLEPFVSRRRDTWGYIIQVLLELITESSLSLSPEPPAASRPGTRGKYEPWSVSGGETGRWPGSAGPGITGDTNKESINNISHTREKESWLEIKSSQCQCLLRYEYTWSVTWG